MDVTELQNKLSTNLDSSVKSTVSMGSKTGNRLRQFFNSFKLGRFYNVIVTLIGVVIMYYCGLGIFAKFDYNNKIEFIRRCFFTWLIMFTIIAIYLILFS